nr:MAG TPA: hypothetical protein [Bacteriophage sp.]
MIILFQLYSVSSLPGLSHNYHEPLAISVTSTYISAIGFSFVLSPFLYHITIICICQHYFHHFHHFIFELIYFCILCIIHFRKR